MSGPYQGRDLSNCGVGRLRVAINCGVLSVKAIICGIYFVNEVTRCGALTVSVQSLMAYRFKTKSRIL